MRPGGLGMRRITDNEVTDFPDPVANDAYGFASFYLETNIINRFYKVAITNKLGF